MEPISDNSLSQINITVVFSNGRSCQFMVKPTDTISNLKKLIYSYSKSLDVTPQQNTLFLYQGKSLDNSSKIGDIEPDLKSFAINCFILSKVQKQKIEEASLPQEYIDSSSSYLSDIFWSDDQSESSTSYNSNSDSEWFSSIFTNDLPLDGLFGHEDTEPVLTQRASNRIHSMALFILGLAIGCFFGIGALIFSILTYRKKIFLTGTLLGACFHYVSNIFYY